MLMTVFLAACTPDDVALPTPTGPHGVGYTTLPEFYMTAFYPGEVGTGRGTPTYFSDATLAANGMTSSQIGTITMSAEIGAAPADGGPWPFVVVGPGGSSYAELSTTLAEELASHGYVVVLVQPDAAAEGGYNLGDTPSEEDATRLMEAQEEARLAQLSAAIDLAEDPLTVELVGEVDPTLVAVGGHSYGGHSAYTLAARDPRVTAVFDLDGALYDETVAVAPPVPALAVLADLYQFIVDPEAFAGESGEEAGLATLDLFEASDSIVSVGLIDAGHYAVTDLPLLLPAFPQPYRDEFAAGLGDGGEVGTTNTSTLVLRFLDAVFTDPATVPAGEALGEGLTSVDTAPF